MYKILDIARLAGLRVNADGEIGPAFFGSVDAGYKTFAIELIKECVCEIHGTDTKDLKGKSYYLDLVAEHIENHFNITG